MASRRGRGRGRRYPVCETREREKQSLSSGGIVNKQLPGNPNPPKSGTDHTDMKNNMGGQGTRRRESFNDRSSGSEVIKMEECFSQNDGVPVQICVVCGDKASGQYFGAVVCLPCKSFYIRCTKDGEPFFSTRCHGNCDVTKQARIRCQSCRFQKCLDAGMSRREKPERVDPEEGQFLCLVCGDLANGIHFGVFTCEGCKKFFRRGLVENRSYNCKEDNSCVMNPRSRNTCRACRYRKCLDVGMSREAIKMGRPKKSETDTRKVKTQSPKLSLSSEESLDVILVHSNDSDSEEDVKLFEIPVCTSEQLKQEETDHGLTMEQSQRTPPTPNTERSSLTDTVATAGDVYRKTWSTYTEKPIISGVKKTPNIHPSPQEPMSFPSTVTSGSEYTVYDDNKGSSGTRNIYTKQERQSSIVNLNDADIPAISAECTVESVQTNTDMPTIYSMSNEDIDSMLKLLEDFERPTTSSVSRRRTSTSEIDEDRQQKRKRDNDGRENLESGVQSYSQYGEVKTRPFTQAIQTDWISSTDKQRNLAVKLEPTESNINGTATPNVQYPTTTHCVPRSESIASPSLTHTSPSSRYTSHSRQPPFSSNTLNPQSVSSPSAEKQCNCQCWTKRSNRVQGQILNRKGYPRSSLNDILSKGSNSTSSTEKTYNKKVFGQHVDSQSVGEISKAFEVLYDKLGYSNITEEYSSGDRTKQSRPSIDSWWDVDMNCQCIQVNGGLCLCEDPRGQTTEDRLMSSLPPPVARIYSALLQESGSTYLSRIYKSSLPDFSESGSMTDVQHQILQQLLEMWLMSIPEGTEGKEESCSTNEIAPPLQA